MARKGNAFYYVTSTVPRKWISLGSDAAAARLKWAELENTANSSTDRTFAALASRYVEECLGEASANWRHNVGWQTKRLVAVFGHMPLDEILPCHVAEYLDRHPKPATANQGISIMGVMYEKAMRWGWTNGNPTKGIRKRKLERRARYITDAEFVRIRECAAPVVRAAMDIAYLTGLRIGDVLSLRRDQITPDGLSIVQQKTGARQTFELTPALSAALAAAKATNGRVSGLTIFLNTRGRPLAYQAFYKHWQEAVTTAGIPDVHIHDIRAKAATDAKSHGQDYQALLGHTSQAMSERYVKQRESVRVSPLKKTI